MSESKNSGNVVPFIFLFVALAGIVGYGMANPAPVHHEEAGHSEEGHDTTDSHATPDSHGGDSHDSDAPAMDISHAPGAVHDPAGTLNGTSAPLVEPTMSNEQGAQPPAAEAHINSEVDAPPSNSVAPATGVQPAGETVSEGH